MMKIPQQAAAMTTTRPCRRPRVLQPRKSVAIRLPIAIDENNIPAIRAPPHCSAMAGNSATGNANNIAATSIKYVPISSGLDSANFIPAAASARRLNTGFGIRHLLHQHNTDHRTEERQEIKHVRTCQAEGRN
jgi:hypothetical protein